VYGVGTADGAVATAGTEGNWNLDNDGMGKFFQVPAGSANLIDYNELTTTNKSLNDMRDTPTIATIRPTLTETCPWIRPETQYQFENDTTYGLNSVCLSVSGASASTNVLSVEMVFHLEAIDIPLRSAIGVASNGSAAIVARPGVLEHTGATAATQPHVFDEVAGAAAAMAATSAYSYAGTALSSAKMALFDFLPELGAALPLLLAPIGL
jgi:hypothetical protein